METFNYKKYACTVGIAFGVCACLLALTFAYGEVKSWSHPASQGATITVTGEGEATAIPDIATLTYTARETAKTVPEAQKMTETKIKAAEDKLSKLGVADKDMKTLSYTVNPKYEGQAVYCTSYSCPQGKQVLIGYEVSQTMQVKVRKVDDAGKALAVIGEAAITEVSGPDFTVDDTDAVTAEAKAKAIADAKTKAKATARSLGVSLGRIVGFSEGGNGYYPPVMYKAEAMSSAGAAMDSVSVPTGENVTKTTVSITYELE